jgi:hypothetical protein
VIARQLERQMGGTPRGRALAPAARGGRAVGRRRREGIQRRPNSSPHQDAARAAEAQTGIPATFMVAQAAHEIGLGQARDPQRRRQRRRSTCSASRPAQLEGPVAEVTTTEYVDGQPRKVAAKFRAYASTPSRSRLRQADEGQPALRQVVASAGTAQGFAKGLQRAGYATDPAYADKLTRVDQHHAAAAAQHGMRGTRHERLRIDVLGHERCSRTTRPPDHGNNISNANTKGYRAAVELESAGGQFSGAGFFGKGVDVTTVRVPTTSS